MIIGYDAKRAFCNRRGLGNYSRDIIRLMSRYSPDNKLLLYTPKISNGLFDPDPTTTGTILPHRFIDKQIPSLWRSSGICSDIRAHKVDIFHGLSQELPVGIEKTGAKSVVTMHDAIFVRYPELYDPLYRTIFTKKNRYSCRIADRIIAISEQTKSDIIEFFGADPGKIEVIYQGCNNIFRQSVSTDDLTAIKQKYNLPNEFIVTVGAIEKRKNQGIILDALYRGKIDIPLVIIGGKTKYAEEIAKKTHEYSLEHQIIVLDNVSTTDLPAIYHAALCLIYPSLFEGFGIPILEALCCQTPVITSQGSCFAETGGDAALYIDPKNADDVTEKLLCVLTDKQLTNDMKNRGTVHAEKFTDEKIAQRIIALYNKLYEE
jgi:glycosyltransferase involved in cell wall biosynthesis